MKIPQFWGGRRSKVLGLAAATTFTTLFTTVAGVGPSIDDAYASSVSGSYTLFGAQGYGDGSGCGFAGSQFGAFDVNQPVVGMAVTKGCAGGWLVTADGGVFSEGSTPFYGSTGNIHLNKPIVGMAATPDGLGYWLVASDGGIFAFGDAHFYGSTGNIHLNKPIVGMAATSNGLGYWLVASDGGIFAFGDAHFYGSLGGIPLVAPVTAIASLPTGNGYWLVAADGGVFTFGSTGYYGSSSAPLSGGPGGSAGGSVVANPVIALASSASGLGYLLLPAAPGLDPTTPGTTGFNLARQEWLFSGREAALNQSETWKQAASYLAMGESVDPGNTSGYPQAISDLDQLANIPEMGVTPAQAAEANADGIYLDAFFHVSDPQGT